MFSGRGPLPYYLGFVSLLILAPHTAGVAASTQQETFDQLFTSLPEVTVSASKLYEVFFQYPPLPMPLRYQFSIPLEQCAPFHRL
jgi:hypothetical protein